MPVDPQQVRQALYAASPAGRLEKLREALPELDIQWIKLEVAEAIKKADSCIKRRLMMKARSHLVRGERALMAYDTEYLAAVVRDGEVTTDKARRTGTATSATNRDARIRAAVAAYLASPELMKLSFAAAARELVDKRGHKVSVDVLQRKLSAARIARR